MKRVRLYELMTNTYAHNQYMYGAYKYYENYDPEFFALDGVMLESYAVTMVGDCNRIKIKYYRFRFLLIAKVLYDIIRNKHKIVITGARTHWILLFSIFSFTKSIDIHLHGQFFGSSASKVKKGIWSFISKRASLKLACPYYLGGLKLEIIKSIHELPHSARQKVISHGRNQKKIVGIISGNGRSKWKGYDRLRIIEQLGYQIRYYQPAREIINEWDCYLDFMQQIDYLYLNPTNDYYLYSPSGVITDSKNYEKPMIAFDDNEFVQRLIDRGCDGFKLISALKALK